MNPIYLKAWLDSIDGDERFLLIVFAGIVDTLLICAGFLGEGSYVTLTLGTVAAYALGKSYENGIEIKHGGERPPMENR